MKEQLEILSKLLATVIARGVIVVDSLPKHTVLADSIIDMQCQVHKTLRLLDVAIEMDEYK